VSLTPVCGPFPLLTTVVEAYSESWGPCGSVAALMRKFMLEVALPAGAMQVLVVRGATTRHSHLGARVWCTACLLRPLCAPLSRHLPRLQCKAEGNTLLEKFKSTSVPHFLFFRDGHLRDTVVGPNVPQLERALREHVPKADDPVIDPTVRRNIIYSGCARKQTLALV
jgi:hypothetical protein